MEKEKKNCLKMLAIVVAHRKTHHTMPIMVTFTGKKNYINKLEKGRKFEFYGGKERKEER